MELKFTKMEGAGNDYVYINGFEEHIPEKIRSYLAKKLSDRHFGIGGDGIIFIVPGHLAPFAMEMYNMDGSRSPMCGNGMRCVGKYLFDHGMTQGRTVFKAESGGRVYSLHVTETDDGGKALELQVAMGAPILDADKIPVISDTSPVINEPITVGGKEYRMTCVNMGNPHAVVFVDDTDSFDVEGIGPLFEHHERFPKRTNTEFVQVISKDYVKMRVWERGTGETLACGTGCCATGVACVLNGKTGNDLTVEVRGGKIQIRWDREKNLVYMTGPARTVFSGIINI